MGLKTPFLSKNLNDLNDHDLNDHSPPVNCGSNFRLTSQLSFYQENVIYWR